MARAGRCGTAAWPAAAQSVRLQMNRRWLAIFVALVGLLLLANGAMVAYAIPPRSALVVDQFNPYGTEEHIARLKSILPYMYLVAAQGIGLGISALLLAAAFVVGWEKALTTLLLGSGLLAVSAITAIIMVPGSWDIQLIWVLLCGALWWETMRARSRNESAI
jgi:hypothetical protein